MSCVLNFRVPISYEHSPMASSEVVYNKNISHEVFFPSLCFLNGKNVLNAQNIGFIKSNNELTKVWEAFFVFVYQDVLTKAPQS